MGRRLLPETILLTSTKWSAIATGGIMGNKTSIYIADDLRPLFDKYIKRHGSLRGAIVNTMQSIDTMYRIERRKLQELFPQEEINLMLNNAMSTMYLPQSIPNAVLHSTEDEGNATFEMYGVDRSVILRKLQKLTLSQQFALVDWLVEMKGGDPEEVDEV
jgi:hypothetical protein